MYIYILTDDENKVIYIGVTDNLESLVDAGGCSGGNGCASACTRLKDYVYFHGGVAARVEHLTTDDLFDFHNLVLL